MFLFCSIGSFLLVLQCLLGRSLSIQLWPSAGALPTSIPAACRAELSKNITCSPLLISAQFAANGRALDPKTAGQYCTSTCYNSLKVSQETLSIQFRANSNERSLLRPMWTSAVETRCIKCTPTAPTSSPEPPLPTHLLGLTTSPVSKIGKGNDPGKPLRLLTVGVPLLALDSALPVFTMARRQSALTVHFNMVRQCSVQIMEE